MKRLLAIVLIALVGLVLAAPGMIDWNTYRDEIAGRVSAATGRPVTLAGPLSLSLLPAPAFTVRDARIANLPGGSEPDMARLESLDVKVALMPLLAGRIEVESVTLVRPVILLEVLPDGRFNWDIGERGASGGATLDPVPGRFASDVSFDQVNIHKGTILYRDGASGHAERFEKVEARIAAGGLGGPFQAHLDFALRGVDLSAGVTTGRFTEGAAVPLRIALSLPGSDATLRFAGIMAAASGGALRTQGDVRAEGGDAARPAEAARRMFGGPELSAGLAGQPFSLRTSLEATASAATLNGLEVQIADTRISGTARLRAPTDGAAGPDAAGPDAAGPDIEATLAVGRIDLDAWLGRLAGAASSRRPAPPVTGRAVAGNPAGPAGPAVDDIALPADLTARLDLAVDGIAHRGTLVRQSRLVATLADGRLTVERAAAQLPGGTDVTAAGSLAMVDGRPAVTLRLDAASENLRTLLDWWKADLGGVPADHLRKAALSLRLNGGPGRIEVPDINLRVDASHLTGGLTYVDRGRPAFGARFDIDRLDLDGCLPDAVLAARPASVSTDAEAREIRALSRLLSGIDLGLEATIGRLTAHGVTLNGVRIDAVASGGAVSLREATAADMAGAKVSVSGRLGGVLPLHDIDLTLAGEAAAFDGVARLVGWPDGVLPPHRLGAVSAEGRLVGDPQRLAVELAMTAAGGSVLAGGTLDRGAGTMKVRLTHPDSRRLIGLVTGDGAGAGDPGGADPGAVDLYAEVATAGRTVTLSGIQGTVGETAMAGRVALDLSGPRPRFEADVQTGEISLDRHGAGEPAAPAGLPATPAVEAEAGDAAPLALDWLRNADGRLALTMAGAGGGGYRLDRPALRAVLDDGVLTLEQLDGGLMGGQLGLTGRLAVPASGPAEGDISVTVVRARPPGTPESGGLALGGGTLDIDLSLSAAGFRRGAAPERLVGEGRVMARDGVIKGFDIAALRDRLGRAERPAEAIEAVARGLQGGQTAFTHVDGRFAVAGGMVRLDGVRLLAAAGEASAEGQIDLFASTGDVRLRIQPRGETALPPVMLRLSGSLDRPTRSFETREVQEFFAKRR